MEMSGEKVLVRGVNWVGDAVMTLPAMRAIRRALPHAHVSLLVKPWVAALFERDPSVNDILLYTDKHKGMTGKIRLALQLRKQHFDRAILLQNALDAAVLAALAGIPRREGYARDGRGLLLTNALEYHDEDRRMHHVDYYLDMLEKLGIPAVEADPWIFLDVEERRAARERLAALPRPVVGINPGAAYGSAKQWLPERFAEVARRVMTELGGSAVVFGGPGEAQIAADIVGLFHDVPEESFLNLAGKTTLRELVTLTSACDVFLSNDSGPMHIAYALKTPLVAVFGSTEPDLTGPLGKGSIVLKKDVFCSPCFERTCGQGSLSCMDAINASEVFEHISSLVPRKPAVFFDRDGTLCRDADYLNDWENFHPFEDLASLDELKAAGFGLVGISNQSGIARGIVDEGFAAACNNYFVDRHSFDAFYHCPHHPDDHCSCRKPQPGMALQARAEMGLDLQRSYVVGDKDDDMLLARAIGARGVLVTTGKQQGSEHADFVACDLASAVRWILADKAL
jgi:heptosyltransferase-2